MKRVAIIYGELTDLQKKAIEVLGEFLLEYTKEYPMCFENGAPFDKENFHCIYIGTKATNPYIKENSKACLTKEQEYLIKVEDGVSIIEGYDDAGVLYGCVDFYNKYLLSIEYKLTLYFSIKNPFEEKLPDFELWSSPSVKDRGIWTWGHVIYNYRSFIDNMLKLKMNTLIVWNDFVPINAKEMIEYAHSNGVKVFFGFSWCWDTDCNRFSLDTILNESENVFEKYEKEYANLNADGIYFQSFTELDKDNINGILIADAVTKFVNHTSNLFFEKYPAIELQFGLHANSVHDKLQFIKNVDERIRIVWENCKVFPFIDFTYDDKLFEEGKSFVKEIALLRGNADKFGVVTKCSSALDWNNFKHADSSVFIGKGSKSFIDNRIVRKSKLWKMVQSYWFNHADKAYEMIKLMADVKKGDLLITSLVEDGVFEENIFFHIALYSEMLWDTDSEYKELVNQVALRDYITFA